MTHEHSSQPWYVIYTYPNYEKRIYNALLRQNIESFLPLHEVIRQWSDRKKKLEVPLFPNYIFVRSAEKDVWRILGVNGVVKFVCLEGLRCTISNETVESIKRITEANVELTNEIFSEGDIVRVLDGPLIGLNGVLVEKKGRTKLAVSVDIMKQSVLVDISPQNVERLEFAEV